MDDNDFETNPWAVKNLDDFLFYNCPECNLKDHSKALFIQHALDVHPKAKKYLPGFTAVKKEVLENEFDDVAVKCEVDFGNDDIDLDEKIDDFKEEHMYEIDPFSQDYEYDSLNTIEKQDEIIEDSERLQCDHCEKTFKSTKYLKSHIRSFHGGAKFKKTCDICNKQYSNASQLYVHKKSMHNEGAKLYKCDKCDFETNHRMPFKRHMVQKHEENQPYNCDKCTFKCYEKWRFNQHYNKHVRERNCDMCSEVFTSKEDLEEHQLSNHSKKCDFCDKMLYVKNQTAILRHMKEKHQNKPCQICGKVFQHINALNCHMKTFHDIDPLASVPKEVCVECGKLVGKKAMNRHMADVHMGVSQELPCEKCGKKFSNSYKLTKHIKNNHEKQPCPQCGKVFADSKMKTHILAVHTEDHLKPYVCQICKKGFAKKQPYEYHMNGHTGNKPCKCKYCGKGFADAGNQRMHERTTHEGFKRGSSSHNH